MLVERKGMYMPKETIHWGPRYIYDTSAETGPTSYREKHEYKGRENGEPLPDNWALSREPNLQVFWHKPNENTVAYDEDPAGYVQVGLDVDILDLENIAKVLERDDGESSATILTWNLSRSQINNMIKVLKRARDAAYGADE